MLVIVIIMFVIILLIILVIVIIMFVVIFTRIKVQKIDAFASHYRIIVKNTYFMCNIT